jgi:predicted ABC-type ATPase
MTETTPSIVVLSGPNGAGKSTLAPVLLRETLTVLDYINADTIAQGLSAFAPERQAFSAGRIMLRRLHGLAERRQSFAFESTLATRSYAPWLGRLVETGYEVSIVFLWLQAEDLAVARVGERVRTGGHDVPEDVIRRRYRRGIYNFRHSYSPLARHWSVFDNSGLGSPGLVARGVRDRVLEVRDGQLWTRFWEGAK